MGDQHDKDILATECLNVNIKTVNEVFRTSKTTIPCVYLFKLGKVKDLKDTFNIEENKYNDDDYLYKYGMTSDIQSRTKQLARKYNIRKNASLELDIFTYVDVVYISEAEAKLSHYFDLFNFKLDNTEFTELVVIPKSKYKFVDVSNKYMGRNTELITQIKDLKRGIEITFLETNLKIQQLENMNNMKDRELENVDKYNRLNIENINKDIELYKLKYDLLEIKNSKS